MDSRTRLASSASCSSPPWNVTWKCGVSSVRHVSAGSNEAPRAPAENIAAKRNAAIRNATAPLRTGLEPVVRTYAHGRVRRARVRLARVEMQTPLGDEAEVLEPEEEELGAHHRFDAQALLVAVAQHAEPTADVEVHVVLGDDAIVEPSAAEVHG